MGKADVVQKPRFITFEGGEGAGKSTLLGNLVSRLEAAGGTVAKTREPGGTPLAERLRSALFHVDPSETSPSVYTEALVISAARRDHVDHFIRPALGKGHWVFCDRFTDSTRAYQGGALDETVISTLEALATDGLKPGLTFLLDADPKDLLARRQERGGPTDIFERRPMSFHEEVRQSFLELARRFPERIVVLNALQTPEELAAEAMSVLDRVYGLSEDMKRAGL